MANLDFSIRNVKVFPEVIPITSTIATLPVGLTDMIRIWQNPDKSKVVKGLDFNFAAVDNVYLNIRPDNYALDSLHTNSLPGVNEPFHVESAHEMYWARDQSVYTLANNTGGTVSNYTSMARILVDALDTASKIIMNYPLVQRDLDAIANLKTKGVDVYEQAQLAIGLPQTFEQFLEIHEVKGPYCFMETLPQGTNLSTNNPVDLVNMDVPNKGKEALVVESLWVQVGAASDLGNVQILISRDDDLDYITLDPAAFPQNSNFNGNMVELDLHVHAFDRLRIQVNQVGGTHNGFKAAAGMSRRGLGLAFKAKMKEFLEKLPLNVDITTAEQAIIDQKNLADYIRTGLLAVG